MWCWNIFKKIFFVVLLKKNLIVQIEICVETIIIAEERNEKNPGLWRDFLVELQKVLRVSRNDM